MKKTTLSFSFIAASVAYVAYLYFTGPADVSLSASSSTPASSSPAATVIALAPASASQSPAGSSPDPTVSVSSPTSTPAPTPVSSPSGKYVDGTYTGDSEGAYYGTVQVEAVVQGGKLAAVNFLQYPSDRRTSQNINNRAMAVLKSEAIQAQSADVSIVSGATDTSTAFQQSLTTALAQAKA